MSAPIDTDAMRADLSIALYGGLPASRKAECTERLLRQMEQLVTELEQLRRLVPPTTPAAAAGTR